MPEAGPSWPQWTSEPAYTLSASPPACITWESHDHIMQMVKENAVIKEGTAHVFIEYHPSSDTTAPHPSCHTSYPTYLTTSPPSNSSPSPHTPPYHLSLTPTYLTTSPWTPYIPPPHHLPFLHFSPLPTHTSTFLRTPHRVLPISFTPHHLPPDSPLPPTPPPFTLTNPPHHLPLDSL